MAKLNETEMVMNQTSMNATQMGGSKFDELVAKGKIKKLGKYDPWLHALKTIKWDEVIKEGQMQAEAQNMNPEQMKSMKIR